MKYAVPILVAVIIWLFVQWLSAAPVVLENDTSETESWTNYIMASCINEAFQIWQAADVPRWVKEDCGTAVALIAIELYRERKGE